MVGSENIQNMFHSALDEINKDIYWFDGYDPLHTNWRSDDGSFKRSQKADRQQMHRQATNNAMASGLDQLASKIRNFFVRSFLPSNIQSKCSVYSDSPDQMTGGRLLARFLAKYMPFYYTPNGKADLDQAWAHFEHCTLARTYCHDTTERAPMGERDQPTQLYPLLSTSIYQCFCTRIYFSTCIILAFFLGLAGILNIPLSLYFYSTYSEASPETSVPWAVRASALCSDQEWVDDLQTYRNVCNFDDWLIPGLWDPFR